MAERDISDYQPLDPTQSPRFSGIPTFMRLPAVNDPSDVDIALFGVPFDGGSPNRTGSRHGPRQLRYESGVSIRRYHPVTNISPFELCRVADLGDAPVNPIDLMDSLNRIEAYARKIVEAGAVPLAAGGDHLISLPILRAVAKDGSVGVVQFDAHVDTYDSFFDKRFKYNNGTPFRRAIEEGLIDPKRMVQIGIRGSRFSRDDLDYGREVGIRVITIDEYFDVGPKAVVEEIRRIVGGGRTYVTFDLDAIDPSYVPGNGSPEVGGLSTRDAQVLLRGLSGLNIIGADVNELVPPLDPSGNTAIVAANLMFEILCVIAVNRARPGSGA
jgi:guanidinopropionase